MLIMDESNYIKKNVIYIYIYIYTHIYIYKTLSKHMRKGEIIFNYLLLNNLYSLTYKSSYAHQLLFVIMYVIYLT